MNWIKQNTFLAGLVATVVVGGIVLWVLGSGAAGRYDEAKQQYETALADTMRYEKLELYPSAENLKNKKAALEEYSTETDELQKAFVPYRPEEMDNISVQAFADAVKRANRQTRSAFKGNDIEIPDGYHCGFELYRTALPAGNSTGILNYQLEVVEKLMLSLAESGISSLVSVHRPKLPEEEGKPFEPTKTQVARELPVEIVFQGREAAARKFLSSIVNDKENYMVLRSIRISNEKLSPPRTTDASFGSRPKGGGNAAPAPAGDQAPDFSALFQPTGDPPADGEEGAEAAAPAPPAAPIMPEITDSSRILSQVLGDEEIQVFVRVDALLFLEPKELP